MRSWWSASRRRHGVDDPVLERRFVEASRRAEILAELNASRTSAEVAHVTVDELSEAYDAEVAFVICTVPEHGRRETLGQTGLTPAVAAQIDEDPLCRAALGTTRATAHAGDDLLGMGVRHLVLSPWTADDGRQVVIGVARLYDQPFEPAEMALLEAVTDGVGHGLERAWADEQRERHAVRQGALASAARTVSATLDRRRISEALTDAVARGLEADVVVIYEKESDGGLRVAAGHGLPPGVVGRTFSSCRSLWAEVARTGEARVLQPFQVDVAAQLPGLPALRSGLAAPIRAHGRISGVVLAGYRSERWTGHEDLELLSAFAELGGIACANADDHAAARRAASRDSLTGCLNHGAFQDRLRQEIARSARTDGELALVLMDLDDFKAVNDSFGHLVGDALLRQMARALREAVRPYDEVARYGGDEFAVLLPNTDERTARFVVDRALAEVASIRLSVDAHIGATAGLSHWRPGVDADSLIGAADDALLAAKRERRRHRGPAARGRSRGRSPDEERLSRLTLAAAMLRRLPVEGDAEAVLAVAVAELESSFGHTEVIVARPDADDGLHRVAATGAPPAAGGPGSRAGGLDEVLRRSLSEGRVVVEEHAGGEDAARSAGNGPRLAAPIVSGGEPWGAIAVRPGEGVRTSDEIELIEIVADQLGVALHAAELRSRLASGSAGA